MSLYQFSPTPGFNIGEHEFATWTDGFTKEELDLIEEIASRREKTDGLIGGAEGSKNSEIRASQVSWIELANDTDWLYSKLAYIANQLNGQFYKFDLYGFNEHFQYTVYDGETNGHYNWHIDAGKDHGLLPPRKLSLVLQLSDPEDYEGGDLEIMTRTEPDKVLKQKGLVAVFPSFRLHRVTPVTKGIRKSLVAWITGPSFR